LTAGTGDVLIVGTTAFDLDEVALSGVQREWTSTRDAATRVANRQGTGSGLRLNGDSFLKASSPSATVLDDGAADRLKGVSAQDWFLANRSGGVLDILTELSIKDSYDELA